MAATGTVTIEGKQYTWTSPTLADLEQFEAAVGPITDLLMVNSVRGRAYLAHLCLRKEHPDLTAGVIRTWPASAFADLWPMIAEAIPLWERPSRPPDASAPARSSEGSPSPSPDSTSPPSSGSPDGGPAEPDESG